MTYQEQLDNPSWKSKRESILKRDLYKCTVCGKDRPKFQRLSYTFGIKSFEDLKSSDLGIFYKDSNDSVIFWSSSGLMGLVKYIGDKNRPFNIDILKFSMRFNHDEKAIKSNWRPEYVCFYEEDFNGEEMIDLNVHHKRYIIDCLAWEYDNEDLITLCHNCHKHIHNTTSVPVLSKIGETRYIANNCYKCGGSGYLPEYYYYKGGICFSCWGEGVILKEF